MKATFTDLDWARSFVRMVTTQIDQIVFDLFQQKYPGYDSNARKNDIAVSTAYIKRRKVWGTLGLVATALALIVIVFGIWGRNWVPESVWGILLVTGLSIVLALAVMVRACSPKWKISDEGRVLLGTWHEGLLPCGLNGKVIRKIVENPDFNHTEKVEQIRSKCAEALTSIKQRSRKEFEAVHSALAAGGIIETSLTWHEI